MQTNTRLNRMGSAAIEGFYRLPATGYRLPAGHSATRCPLPARHSATRYPLPAARCPLPAQRGESDTLELAVRLVHRGHMADYRNLEVWQAAHRLTLDVYRATVAFPKEEMYGLVTQTRRAVASIPTNLAEGSGRGSDDDYARFVRFASGSANEVEYQLLLAKDLGYLDEQMWSPLASEVSRVRSMLSRLNQTLKR